LRQGVREDPVSLQGGFTVRQFLGFEFVGDCPVEVMDDLGHLIGVEPLFKRVDGAFRCGTHGINKTGMDEPLKQMAVSHPRCKNTERKPRDRKQNAVAQGQTKRFCTPLKSTRRGGLSRRRELSGKETISKATPR